MAPADLAGLPSLGQDLPHGEHRWKLQGPGAAVPHTPRLVSDDRQVLRTAALQDLGVQQLPLMRVRHALQQGRLVDLLPDWHRACRAPVAPWIAAGGTRVDRLSGLRIRHARPSLKHSIPGARACKAISTCHPELLPVTDFVPL